MIICDVCKKDPTAGLPEGSSLRGNPWGIILMPPAGSGLPERRACYQCSLKLFDFWVSAIIPKSAVEPPKPN